MRFTEEEIRIIRTFHRNLNEYDNSTMILRWHNQGEVTATFDTCFDDDNDLDDDEEGYEEFNSYLFTAIAVEGAPPVYISRDNCVLLNYHNFPDEILVDGKKIN